MAGGADKAKAASTAPAMMSPFQGADAAAALIPTNILRLKGASLANAAGPTNEARPEARAESSRILVVGTRLAEKGRGA